MLVTAVQVRARLKMLTASDNEPVLADPADIDVLFDQARRVDLFGVPPDNFTEWEPGTGQVLGDIVVPPGRVGNQWDPIIRAAYFYYTCTTAGTSAQVEPAWPTAVGGIVVDGDVQWTCSGPASWHPRYDLYYAVAQGWLVKSTRLVGHYNFMVGGKMLSRQQFYDHCMEMHRKFSMKSGVKALRLGSHEVTLGAGHTPTNAD